MHRCFWRFRPNCLAEPELCRDMRLIPSPSLGIWLVRRVTPATAVFLWCEAHLTFVLGILRVHRPVHCGREPAAPLNRGRHPQLFSLTNLSWRWKFEQGHVQCSIGVSISHPQICKMACVISHDSLHTPVKATHGNTFKEKPWWTVFWFQTQRSM